MLCSNVVSAVEILEILKHENVQNLKMHRTFQTLQKCFLYVVYICLNMTLEFFKIAAVTMETA